MSIESLIWDLVPRARVDVEDDGGDRRWIDVVLGDRRVVVEHRAELGYGVSSYRGPAFDGPDAVFASAEEAARHVVALLEEPAPRPLRELRQRCNVTQEQIASILGLRQSTVSKIERRTGGDLSLGTLRDFVVALGGTLQVVAHLPDTEIEIELTPIVERPRRRKAAAPRSR